MAILGNKIKGFKDAKRRMKEKALQNLGVVTATDDSIFTNEYGTYRQIVVAVQSLRKSFQKHLDALRLHASTGSALAIELATFHQETDAGRSTQEIGQAHVEFERVQLAAIEKVYEEEVLNTVDLMLWHVPDIEEKVRRRKRLLLDYDAHLRKFEMTKHSLEEAQANGTRKKSVVGVVKRNRTETDLAEDLATRKMKLEHAQMAVDDLTEDIRSQFQAIATKFETGKIMEGPMSATLACQLHMHRGAGKRLDKLKTIFPSTATYATTLKNHDAEFNRLAPLDIEGFAHMTNMSKTTNSIRAFTRGRYGKKAGGKSPTNASNGALGNPGVAMTRGLMFGRRLDSSTPGVICDCIEFIRGHGIRTPGLFRVPGDQEVVNSVRALYDDGSPSPLTEISHVNVEDVCTLLKKFFRELPEPLVPSSCYEPLLTAMRTEQQDARDGGSAEASKVIEITLKNFPKHNLELLGLLFKFLLEISKHATENKMSTVNLATCFTPSLMRAPEDVQPNQVLHDMPISIAAINRLIVNSDRLPTPPAKQVRNATTYKAKDHPERNLNGESEYGAGLGGNVRGGDVVESKTSRPIPPPPGLGYSAGSVKINTERNDRGVTDTRFQASPTSRSVRLSTDGSASGSGEPGYRHRMGPVGSVSVGGSSAGESPRVVSMPSSPVGSVYSTGGFSEARTAESVRFGPMSPGGRSTRSGTR